VGSALGDRSAGQQGCGKDSAWLSEDELTELAMAADPTAPIAEDAIPIGSYLAGVPSLLPTWYMPGAMARSGKGWRVPVVLAIVAAFVIIEAFGLCSTYGQIVIG
jgi:hypothetical protein